MIQSDEKGCYKLSGKEYMELLHLFAASSTLKYNEPHLKERLQLIPNGWRDYRMLCVRIDKLLEKILKTVPTKKLYAIRKDLRSVKMRVVMSDEASTTVRDGSGVVSVNEDALISMLNLIVQMECMFCDKKGSKAKNCPYLKMIEDVIPYDHDPGLDPEDGSCQLAGRTSVGSVV